jgi:hypothetical protein
MISIFYDNTEINLFTDKGKFQGTFKIKKGKFFITSVGKDVSITREIGVASIIDMAKLVCDAINFKCKKCKKKLSVERGECHHGCLKCHE